VISIGARKIKQAEFAKLLGPPPQRRERRTEHERRQEFLDELLRTELLALHADKLGYLSSEQARAQKQSLMVDRLLDELFGEEGTLLRPVSDAEVRSYYGSHLASFTSEAQVRAAHILLRNEARARALLLRLSSRPRDYDFFATLARTESLDAETRKHGGDLGSFTASPPAVVAADVVTSPSLRPRKVPAAVREAAFELQTPGSLSPTPVKSEQGYHLIMLVGRRPASRAELPQVERVIRQQLEKQRRDAAFEAFIAKLRADAHVQIDETKLRLLTATR
jgi:peptidyl-prolyl cis-trans isomerase C